MKPDFHSSLIAGLFGAEMLGLLESNLSLLEKFPLIPSISIRFDPDTNLLTETVKESFVEESEVTIKFLSKNDLEILFQIDYIKKRGGKSIHFKKCFYNVYKKDAFLIITLRDEKGYPMTRNISLLRNFIKKLNEKKIKFEIW
jgi:hypothetical protein